MTVTSANIYFTCRYINIYDGELAYYMFYTVVIVTFIYLAHRNYYGGGLTFL